MGAMLSERGMLFLDVNNRHNAASYGILKVACRVIIDLVAFKEHRGDATYHLNVGPMNIRGCGHLFTPMEIKHMMRASNLRIADRVSLDYRRGNRRPSTLLGQLVYKVVKT
jgi:hypothetical protein